MKELEPQALTVSRGWNSERKVSMVMIPSEGCEEESILCTSLSLWWTWGTHCYSSVFRLRSPIPSPAHSILLCSPTQFHSFSLQSLLYLFIYLIWGTNVSQRTCWDQRSTCGNQSYFTMWIPEMEHGCQAWLQASLPSVSFCQSRTLLLYKDTLLRD